MRTLPQVTLIGIDCVDIVRLAATTAQSPQWSFGGRTVQPLAPPHQITVCDEGEGLAADFDPSAPTKSLGMRVVTSLAKQLGGRVEASNRKDRTGSCFEVAFAGMTT